MRTGEHVFQGPRSPVVQVKDAIVNPQKGRRVVALVGVVARPGADLVNAAVSEVLPRMTAHTAGHLSLEDLLTPTGGREFREMSAVDTGLDRVATGPDTAVRVHDLWRTGDKQLAAIVSLDSCDPAAGAGPGPTLWRYDGQQWTQAGSMPVLSVRDSPWAPDTRYVISPEGAASILWRDTTKAQEAATSMKITAQDMVRFRIIDSIVPEPTGGAHRDPQAAIAVTGEAIANALSELRGLDRETVRKQRRDKFLAMGRAAV